MENNDLSSGQPSVESPVSGESTLKKTFTPKFIIALGILLIVGGSAYGYVSYLARKNYNEVVRQAQLAQESNRIVYSNELFGFSIALPDSWRGYAVNHIKEDIYDVTGRTTTNNGVVDSLQLIELHHPLESANNPREVMPIMVLTHTQWQHIYNHEWSVGAAPIPPSLLGENSQWVLALPARYNYDFKPGWEEVDQLVHTLQAFEPATGSMDTSALDQAGWKTYTNTEYGFEFKYPGEFYTYPEDKNPQDGPISVFFGTNVIVYIFINSSFGAFAGIEKNVENHRAIQGTETLEIELGLNKILSLQFDGDGNKSILINQILSTFRFTK